MTDAACRGIYTRVRLMATDATAIIKEDRSKDATKIAQRLMKECCATSATEIGECIDLATSAATVLRAVGAVCVSTLLFLDCICTIRFLTLLE